MGDHHSNPAGPHLSRIIYVDFPENESEIFIRQQIRQRHQNKQHVRERDRINNHQPAVRSLFRETGVSETTEVHKFGSNCD